MVGADVTPAALAWAARNLGANPQLQGLVEVRAVQMQPEQQQFHEQLGGSARKRGGSGGGGSGAGGSGEGQGGPAAGQGPGSDDTAGMPEAVAAAEPAAAAALGPREAAGSGIISGAVRRGERFAFCMCNPPFFESLTEAGRNPATAFGGTAEEMVYPGGAPPACSAGLPAWRAPTLPPAAGGVGGPQDHGPTAKGRPAALPSGGCQLPRPWHNRRVARACRLPRPLPRAPMPRLGPAPSHLPAACSAVSPAGGELAFVSAMVQDSLALRGAVHWCAPAAPPAATPPAAAPGAPAELPPAPVALPGEPRRPQSPSACKDPARQCSTVRPGVLMFTWYHPVLAAHLPPSAQARVPGTQW